MRRIAIPLAAVLVLAGCGTPRAGVGVSLSSDGDIDLTSQVSGSLGAGTWAISR